jgi:hypothetical protein
MRFASALLGLSTASLDKSMNAWWEVTKGKGTAPLGADRTVTENPYNEYHVWPTAAAGAWTILSRLPKQAELPATRIEAGAPTLEAVPAG